MGCELWVMSTRNWQLLTRNTKICQVKQELGTQNHC